MNINSASLAFVLLGLLGTTLFFTIPSVYAENKIVVGDEGLDELQSDFYSMSFPSGWKYDFDGKIHDGTGYLVRFTDESKNEMIGSFQNGLFFGKSKYSNAQIRGVNDLGSMYKQVDDLRDTTEFNDTVGSMFVVAETNWSTRCGDDFGNDSGDSKRFKLDYRCLEIQLDAIRYERIDGIPVFQIEYQYDKRDFVD